jgi:hypothetical protein
LFTLNPAIDEDEFNADKNGL